MIKGMNYFTRIMAIGKRNASVADHEPTVTKSCRFQTHELLARMALPSLGELNGPGLLSFCAGVSNAVLDFTVLFADCARGVLGTRPSILYQYQQQALA